MKTALTLLLLLLSASALASIPATPVMTLYREPLPIVQAKIELTLERLNGYKGRSFIEQEAHKLKLQAIADKCDSGVSDDSAG